MLQVQIYSQLKNNSQISGPPDNRMLTVSTVQLCSSEDQMHDYWLYNKFLSLILG